MFQPHSVRGLLSRRNVSRITEDNPDSNSHKDPDLESVVEAKLMIKGTSFSPRHLASDRWHPYLEGASEKHCRVEISFKQGSSGCDEGILLKKFWGRRETSAGRTPKYLQTTLKTSISVRKGRRRGRTQRRYQSVWVYH